jgi:hypothetical protein
MWIEIKSINDRQFWFGKTLIDTLLLERHSFKKGTRPWGYGHTIMHSIGTLRRYAEHYDKGYKPTENQIENIQSHINNLRKFNYPIALHKS